MDQRKCNSTGAQLTWFNYQYKPYYLRQRSQGNIWGCQENARIDMLYYWMFIAKYADIEPIIKSLSPEQQYHNTTYLSPTRMNQNDQWQNVEFIWRSGSVHNDTTIDWRIYFTDTSGNINKTDILTFSYNYVNLPPFIPQQPFPVDNEVGVLTTIELEWEGGDPNNDQITYDVYFGDTNPPPLVQQNQSQISYDPGQLTLNTTYYWRIMAWDDLGAKTLGPLWMFITNKAPNKPQAVFPANQSVGITPHPVLNWTGGDPDIDDTVNYDVYFGDSLPIPRVTLKQTQTTYTPGTLSLGQTYYWQIKARDNHYAFSKSDLFFFRVNAPPNNITSPDPANGSIDVDILTDLSWNCSDPDGQNLTYAIYFGETNPPPKIVNQTSNSTYDPGILDLLTTYYWQIDAWDTYNLTVSSPVWLFTTRDNSPPYPASDPDPPNDATGVPLEITLHWSGGDPDPGDSVTYDVYFGSGNPPPLVSSNQEDTSYTPDPLTYTLKYYWKIVTHDLLGETTEGPLWTFTARGLPEPDLSAVGSLSWTQIPAGSSQTGFFTVQNVGEPLSALSWEIDSYPEWGSWQFTPESGYNLTPDLGPLTITVEVVAPNQQEETEQYESEI